mmetsp:Transcript_46807/g.117961  ORF Transcript_46807/g.117961 Transcript_46807/m.117961 type:complete len:357 (-) Transcript_46807:988-2058(-)
MLPVIPFSSCTVWNSPPDSDTLRFLPGVAGSLETGEFNGELCACDGVVVVQAPPGPPPLPDEGTATSLMRRCRSSSALARCSASYFSMARLLYSSSSKFELLGTGFRTCTWYHSSASMRLTLDFSQSSSVIIACLSSWLAVVACVLPATADRGFGFPYMSTGIVERLLRKFRTADWPVRMNSFFAGVMVMATEGVLAARELLRWSGVSASIMSECTSYTSKKVKSFAMYASPVCRLRGTARPSMMSAIDGSVMTGHTKRLKKMCCRILKGMPNPTPSLASTIVAATYRIATGIPSSDCKIFTRKRVEKSISCSSLCARSGESNTTDVMIGVNRYLRKDVPIQEKKRDTRCVTRLSG